MALKSTIAFVKANMDGIIFIEIITIIIFAIRYS